MNIDYLEQIVRISSYVTMTIGVIGTMHYIFRELEDINDKLDEMKGE